MKKLVKKILIGIVIALILGTLGGCGDKSKNENYYSSNGSYDGENIDAMAVVLGNRMNCPIANLEECKDEIKNVCLNEGEITLIESDGDPYVAETINIPPIKEGISQNKKEMNATSQAEEICRYANTVVPKTEEADTLSGLILASRMLSNSNGNKLLVVHDTAITTTGMIDLNSSIMQMDEETIIQQLKANKCIPELEGVKVIWIGIAEPVGKQEKPSEIDYEKIKKLYTRILIEGGVKESDISFRTLGEYGDSSKDYLEVKKVEFSESIIISEDEIGFKVNSTEFINEEKSLQQLEVVVGDYKNNQGILVVGFASSEGSVVGNMEISDKRAKKIASILSERGIDAKGIGLGYDTRYCIIDTDENGNLIEAKASKNRKIIVMSADCSVAKEMLKKYEEEL